MGRSPLLLRLRLLRALVGGVAVVALLLLHEPAAQQAQGEEADGQGDAAACEVARDLTSLALGAGACGDGSLFHCVVLR